MTESSFRAVAVTRLAVHERAAAALCRDFASDEQLFAPTFKNRLDRGRLLAGPDEVPGRAATEQQADRLDEDRLAGARLASEDVQPRLELHLERSR